METSFISKTSSLLKTKNVALLQKSSRVKNVRLDVKGIRVWRITRMMFVISAIYTFNFLPTLAILILTAINKGFAEDTGPLKRAITSFSLKSYFFNCGVNPFVYILFDTKLKAACKRIFLRRNKIHHRLEGKLNTSKS